VFRAGARGVLLALAVLGLVAASVGALPQAAVAASTVDDPSVKSMAATPQNNSTTSAVQQENPDSVGEDGDQEALENWLGDRLASRLGESAVQISEGQYEQAQGLLGDEYNDQLSKYVDVAGDTEGEGAAEERREQFNETAEAQSEYAETASEYQQTYEAYQEAKAAGDEERARRLARKLLDLSTSTERLNRTLQENYGNISANTGVSLDDEQQGLANRTQNITEQADVVVEESFTSTTITARADADGSYSDPIRITGSVETNDSIPPNGTVYVRVHDAVINTSVLQNGTFSVQYRPLTVPTGQVTGDVAYVPEPTSTHLGSNTTMQTNLTQAQPRLQINDTTTAARYGERIRTTGRVMVADQPLRNATVKLEVDGNRFVTARTNASGHYELTRTLPARITLGSHSLAVRVGETGTALAPDASAAPFRVDETETAITVTASGGTDDIRVRGRLLTIDGVGVGGQTLSLTREGSIVRAVETNESGYFIAAIDPPENTAGTTSVQIGATFDGSGTNLEDARQQTSVTGAFGSSGSGGSSSVLPWAAGVGGVAVLLVGGFAFYRSRYQRGTPATDDANAPSADAPASKGAPEARSAAEPEWQDRLTAVQAYLDDNDSEHAVRALYGAVRAAHTIPEDTAKTHWEFYTAVSDELEGDARDTLREMTELYESVQFGGNTPDRSQVSTLLSEAQQRFESEGTDRNQHPAPAESDD